MTPITRSSSSPWPVLHIQHQFIKPRHRTLPQSHSLVLYSAFTCHWRPFLKNLVGLGVLQNCSSDLTKLYCLNDGNVSPSMKEGWRWKFVPKHEVGSIWIAGGILSPTIRIAGGKMFPSMRIAGGSLPVLCSEFEGPGPGRRAEQQDNVGQ